MDFKYSFSKYNFIHCCFLFSQVFSVYVKDGTYRHKKRRPKEPPYAYTDF